MLKLTARLSGLLMVCALTVSVAAQPATTYPNPADRVLTHREQAPLVKGWIQKRFDTVLPQLMSRTGIDMWIIVSREYNDDPVFRSMAPLTTFSSRRRTILVFCNPGGGKADRAALDRPLRLRRPLHGRADAQRRPVRRAAQGRRGARSATPSASTSRTRGITPTG